MSEISKQALKVANNTEFPNNNAGLIQPSNLRAFNEDMIDSLVDEITYNVDSGSWNQRIDSISGSVAVITGSLLLTASFDNGTRNLTFTKGDSSTFNVNIPDASGSVLPSGVVSGSSQIILNSTTGNLFGNRISGPVDDAVNAVSSSYAVTASYALNVETIDTGSLLVTASNDFSQITFTKGDASTFELDVTPRRVVETVKNKNGFMAKGTPVYVSGSTGNELHVYTADAGLSTRVPATFILDQDLDPEESGLGILTGFINGVDTSAFAEGVNIYLAVGGGYTDVQPTGSAFIQKLGNVVKSDLNGSGIISGAGRVNALPNLQQGYAWVGDSNGVPQAVSTGSFAGDSFPYIGDAQITGSLSVSETIKSQIFINPQTITGTQTIPNNYNGMLTGPISNAGTIVIEGNATLVII